ncbi:hypothetical protein H0H81_008124 [Sphagnurus paluster]|uniref:Uncharacterized protein n=1 Tax=Sphagnurus paluster TaxID=117069 RepID=A0A9P7FM28_9AGAR|nr:hypothetical protein H0H81_008124 [Sphagnurus paluster]
MQILEEVYMPIVDVNTTGSKEVDEKRGLLGLKKKKQKQAKAGTWRGIEVYAGETIDTAPLKEKFRENLEKFKKPIQEYEDTRKAEMEGRILAEAQRKAEMESRILAEAQRKAEMESRILAEARLAQKDHQRKAEMEGRILAEARLKLADAEIEHLKRQLEQMANQ